jgi:hypothetical protein
VSDQIETLPQLARLVAYLTNATVYLLRREEERLTRLGEEHAADRALALAVQEELDHVRQLIAQIAGEAQEIAQDEG